MEKLAVETLVLLAVLGAITGLVARSKGRSFIKWWVYGFLVFFIALPHALMLRLGEGTKICPYCHKTSRMSAPFCRSCGNDFTGEGL